MPSATYDEALNGAAATWGIQPDYWDIWGRHHFTAAQTKRAILESLGVPAGGVRGATPAAEQR